MGGVACFSCHLYMLKSVGCAHMDCLYCKKTFCFSCGGPYPHCYCKAYDGKEKMD